MLKYFNRLNLEYNNGFAIDLALMYYVNSINNFYTIWAQFYSLF